MVRNKTELISRYSKFLNLTKITFGHLALQALPHRSSCLYGMRNCVHNPIQFYYEIWFNPWYDIFFSISLFFLSTYLSVPNWQPLAIHWKTVQFQFTVHILGLKTSQRSCFFRWHLKLLILQSFTFFNISYNIFFIHSESF